MDQRVSVITLGVADLEQAIRFYTDLGWRRTGDDEDVAFFQSGGMVFALWSRESLAEDSAVPDNGGWGGVTLAHNVGSRAEVDAVIDEATSGQALCDILLRHRPTLAFVGLQLDDLSGPEAVAVARRAGAEPPCLVLVATRVLPHWQDIATSLGAC